jgi:serine/threonine protein kinase
MSIEIGEELDEKYVVVRRLGGGGFGEVFLAEDEVTGREVAIKVLRADDRDDDLIWEMQTLAALDLPGAVAFYHHFNDGHRLFLVMEHCAGGSLRDRVRGGARFLERQVLDWALSLCSTLGAVHAKGIVHHDIKPANLLFHADGRIKVGDFGVANRSVGTILYLPPEMLLGEPVSSVDPRVDIYSLGLTLIEVLTGAHPFEFMSREGALEARMRQDFVSDALSQWLQDVTLKATHPTPELRFQTMTDFADALAAKHAPYVFDGDRIKAHMLAESAQKLIKRRKWKSAHSVSERALSLAPDCVPALIAAGRSQLMVRRISSAENYFSKAISINPRTPIQNELGWLHLEAGRIPLAISLLSDHLQRNGGDHEAYNLLIKCYFESGRYEAGEALAETIGLAMKGTKSANDSFETNRFLCCLLARGEHVAMNSLARGADQCPFMSYNIEIYRESPRSWGSVRPSLRSKLIFEEYRFAANNHNVGQNTIQINLPDGRRYEWSHPLISIGSLESNDLVLIGKRVSRRHALIVNISDDVWIYDLDSFCGTTVGGRRVVGRAFLDGVHEVEIAGSTLRVGSKLGLLV